jgi:hypothetical protein
LTISPVAAARATNADESGPPDNAQVTAVPAGGKSERARRSTTSGSTGRKPGSTGMGMGSEVVLTATLAARVLL